MVRAAVRAVARAAVAASSRWRATPNHVPAAFEKSVKAVFRLSSKDRLKASVNAKDKESHRQDEYNIKGGYFCVQIKLPFLIPFPVFSPLGGEN